MGSIYRRTIRVPNPADYESMIDVIAHVLATHPSSGGGVVTCYHAMPALHALATLHPLPIEAEISLAPDEVVPALVLRGEVLSATLEVSTDYKPVPHFDLTFDREDGVEPRVGLRVSPRRVGGQAPDEGLRMLASVLEPALRIAAIPPGALPSRPEPQWQDDHAVALFADAFPLLAGPGCEWQAHSRTLRVTVAAEQTMPLLAALATGHAEVTVRFPDNQLKLVRTLATLITPDDDFEVDWDIGLCFFAAESHHGYRSEHLASVDHVYLKVTAGVITIETMLYDDGATLESREAGLSAFFSIPFRDADQA